MEYGKKYWTMEYYKIILVGLEPDSYRILKGPKEEMQLVKILLDDYYVSRYEKMIQLVVREMIEERYRDEFCHIFSLEHLCREFEKGEEKITYSYLREIDGNVHQVRASAYPRKMREDGKLEEFMIYISQQRQE